MRGKSKLGEGGDIPGEPKLGGLAFKNCCNPIVLVDGRGDLGGEVTGIVWGVV